MNKYLFAAFVILFVSAESYSEYFEGCHEITKFNDANNVIKSDAHLVSKGDAISIDKNVFIENYGTIHGDIDLNGNSLGITNFGIIDGKIINTATDTGTVRQNISTNVEFQKLQIGSNIDLSAIITGIKDLSVDKLKNLDAQNYVITDSDIYINDLSEWNNLDTNISFLGGKNNLYIQNINGINQGDTIKYITNTEDVNVELIGVDDLHKIVLVKTDSGLVFNIVRETEVDKIFHDDFHKDLFEKLRDNQKDNNFMNMIDSADTMQDIENIMNKSYHFNHKFLTRPIYVNNNFLMLDFLNQQQKTNINFNVNYIGGNKITGFGGKTDIAGKYDNLFFGIGLNINKLNYKDNINDFDVMNYGPELKLDFNKNDFWIKGISGFSFTQYRAKDIYYKEDFINNPHGKSEYGMLDFGYDFNCVENLKLGVFSGAGIQYIKVLDTTKTEKNLHIGSKIKYSYELIGIKYDLSGIGAIFSNGDLMAGLELGMFSILDEIGAYLKLDAYKNQYDLNYQASINIKTMF